LILKIKKTARFWQQTTREVNKHKSQEDIGISAENILILLTRDLGIFIAKIVDKRYNLSSHQSSAKHHAAFLMKNTSENKHITGFMDKAIAKVNQNELDRYEELFNTPYV
jgi:hypothetical protein